MPDDIFDEEPAWEVIPTGYQQQNAPPPVVVKHALIAETLDFDEEPDEFFADDFGNDDFAAPVAVPTDSQPITEQDGSGGY